MVLRIATVALSFLVQIVMAHVMSLRDFGVANTALAIMNIAVVPAALGYDNASVRYVALARRDHGRLRALNAFFLRELALGSAVTCAVLAVIAAEQYLVGHGAIATSVLLLIVIVPTFALARLGEGWLRGMGSIVKAQIGVGIVIPGAATMLLIGVYIVGGSTPSVSAAAALITRALATVLALALTAVFVLRRLRRVARRGRPRLSSAELSQIRVVALGLCGTGLLAMVTTQIDVIGVSVLGGPSEAGIYSAASRIALAMNVSVIAVNFVLAPRVARFVEEGRVEELQEQVAAAASWSGAFMLAACAVLIPAASPVMHVFGSDFSSGATALRILLLGQLVNGACGGVATVLKMSGRQMSAVHWLSAATLAQIILLVTLIPALGLTGAAIATTICTTIWNLGMVWSVHREFEVWSLPPFPLLASRR
jgi:O-antigen/teichoic acid export membrane protein